MSKQLTITISGNGLVCNFGVNYFYKHLKELTGIDMLADDVKNIVSTDGIGTIAGMVYAAHMAECSLAKGKPEIPLDEVEHHYLSMDATAFVVAVKEIFKVINPEENEEDKPGEAETQAAQP